MSGRILPRRVPAWLLEQGVRRPRLVLMLGLAALVLAAVMGLRVRIETDVLSLVPENDPAVAAFRTTVERFGSVDLLLGVVEVPEEGGLDTALPAADLLAEALKESELIQWVEYRLEGPETTLLPLLDRATLFLPPEEVAPFVESLRGDGGRRSARRLRSLLSSPQGLALKRWLRVDPAGLLYRILGRARTGDVGATFDPDTGYMVDPGQRYVLLLAKPTGPAQDIVFDARLMSELDRIRGKVEARWREEGLDGVPPPVRFTGGYVIAYEDQQLVIRDLKVGVVSSLIGVMLLFVLAFRRPGALLHAFVPLAVGLAATFVFTSLALGRLNSITSAFAALLIGLGIDFVIVLYGRYAEERSLGAGHEAAVAALGRSTAPGVLLGATTTAATFLAFTITRFRGLAELGLLTGVGILLLAGSVFLLLPALLGWAGRRGRWPVTRLRSFGADGLAALSVRRPGRTLAVALVLTGLVATGLFRLHFNDDIRSMRSAGNRGVQLRQRVMEAFGLRFTPLMFRIDGNGEGEVLEAAHTVLPRLREVIDGENLARVESLADVVPPPSAQREVIRRLRDLAPDPAGVVEEFRAALILEGLNPAAFSEGLEHLRHALEVEQPLSLEAFRGTPLEHVVERYLARDGGTVSTVIYCFPVAGKWRREAPPPVERLAEATPRAVLTGPTVVSARLREIVWGDAFEAAGIGLVLVFVLMAADLGGIRQAAVALVPLAFGMVWMLGLMGWLGLEVNLINIFVVTMVIGIGVDYGIHLVHRWEETGGDPAAAGGTARAVVVAALTTMVGFGSLVLSHFPGLRSVGAAAILGAMFSALAAITVLPALLHWRRT